MTFRFNAKHALLTYSQCPLEKEDIQTNLLFTLGERVQRMVIGKEEHANGDPHIHVAILFRSKVNFKRANIFDIDSYHPNIASRGTYKGAETYASKDGDILVYGEEAPNNNNHSEVARNTTDRLEWIEYCIANKIPPGYGDQIWNLTHRNEENDIKEHEVQGRITAALNTVTYNGEDNLVIVGPTGTGKTTWAKREAPKPALWVTHLDDLKKFKKDYHKSILFDDMSFTHLPEQAQIHLVDKHNSRSIHVRYGTVSIPSGIPKIFTANEYPFTRDGEHGRAIRRRIRVLRLDTQLNLE